MARVVLKGITKIYPGNIVALKNINLEVESGEFFVLLGPSGCGKSTTLRIIAGLEEPTQGEIWIGDKKVNGIEPKDRDVAMVFQNYALYPHMTAFDNIAFPLKIRKIKKEEINKKVKEVAETLGIKHILSKKPRELSGGEQQRVALGRAMVREPKVFLFDEPLSNVDAKLRVEMRAELARLHKKLKITTVYVTHDQVEAMTLGERIAVMNNGEIVQVSSPVELYKNPENIFVASFIGSPSMNLIKGEIKNGVFLSNGFVLKNVPPKIFKRFKKIIVGIRPEDIQVSLKKKKNFLKAKVELVEHTGGESIAYLILGKQRIVVKTKEEINLPCVYIFPERKRLHFFDESGKRIN